MINKKGKILSAARGHSGYLVVGLCKNGELKQKSVHGLVMLAFHGERPYGYEVCHGDGDRANNKLENLRYDTRQGNALDKVAHGTNNMGDTNPRAKLNSTQVLEIFKRCMAGENQQEIAADLGISSVTVNHIATGRTWRSVTGASWNRSHVIITPKIVRKIDELQTAGKSLTEIASELGISKASAFRHSKNKSAVLKNENLYQTIVEGSLCT